MEAKWPIKEALQFYWTCVKETFDTSLGISDLCASVFGMLVPVVSHFCHLSDTAMNALYWKVPLYAFLCVSLLRTLLSPFLVYKKLQDKKKRIDARLSERSPKIVCEHYTLQPTPMYGDMPVFMSDGRVVTIPGQVVTNRLWIQLIPKCATESPVNKCRGHLVAILKKNSESKWEKTGFNEVSFLKWSACDDDEITLEPKAERRLCVCYTDQKSSRIHPDSHFVHGRANDDLQLPGTFSFDIKITGENCDPVYISLEVGLDSYPLDDRPRCNLRQGYTMDQADN